MLKPVTTSKTLKSFVEEFSIT